MNVKIIKEFRFPRYKTYQRLFFSEDNNFMIEELENKRTIMYEWFPESEEANSS